LARLLPSPNSPPPPPAAARRLSHTKPAIRSRVGPKLTRSGNQAGPLWSKALMTTPCSSQRLETRVGEDWPLRPERHRGARRGSVGGARRRCVGVRRRRRLGGIGHARLEGALDGIAHTGDVLDIARLDLRLEDCIGNGDRGGLRKEHAHQEIVGQQEGREDQPPRLRPHARRTGSRVVRVLGPTARGRTVILPVGRLAMLRSCRWPPGGRDREP
jgi:hypothetical protein